MQPKTRPGSPLPSFLKLSTLALAAVLATGCASVDPDVLSKAAMEETNALDTSAIRKDVDPITAPLTLDEAIARALKYNLDRRTKLMEEAMALGQLDVTKFDMLPKLLAQAGYMWRDTDRISYSADSSTMQRSNSTPFVSQERIHTLRVLIHQPN